MQPIIDVSSFKRVVFFTGAGMSAESGVPTYRGAGGIWAQYRWEDYACQDAFERDPAKVLDFHEKRRRHVLSCEPHAGHRHLAALQAKHPGVMIVTQNTDGMHQRAGSQAVLELHGSLWRLRCAKHGKSVDLEAAIYARRECPVCRKPLRPDITWFGDGVEEGVFTHAEELIAAADLFVAVGCSGVVWPAAGLLHAARGRRMVEVNVEDTDVSSLFEERVREKAGTALPRLFRGAFV